MTARSMETWCAFGYFGFRLGERLIFWVDDGERPSMAMPSVSGGHVCTEVASRAFDVAPGPIAKRRPAMREAAVAFFAPLLEDSP